MDLCVSFKLDNDLENDPKTCVSSCISAFLGRGGSIVCFPEVGIGAEKPFTIMPGDAVYPVCSGGVCRSQVLWAKLFPFSDRLVLFPPHAARHGWDPYNGQINRDRNQGQEDIPDEFREHFGMQRAERFGFEHASKWENLGKGGELDEISRYYSENYFGPESSFQGRRGKRRVYIAFSNNIHVVMHRLIQSNEFLAGVTLVGIDWEDMVTHPPEHLNIVPRSAVAFKYFGDLLHKVLELPF